MSPDAEETGYHVDEVVDLVSDYLMVVGFRTEITERSIDKARAAATQLLTALGMPVQAPTATE